jgi:3'-5' exoribonuclease
MVIQKHRDIEETFDYFVSIIGDKKLRSTCNSLYEYEDFWTHIASTEHHHCFPTGLILHTLEVADNAHHISKHFSFCDKDILITSALWHDLAKIWDYAKRTPSTDNSAEWEKTEFRARVHHVSGSNAEFTANAIRFGVNRQTIQAIQHCIIAHHCTKDWGSPRHPASIEAIILHQADMLSAKYPKFSSPII